MGIRDLEHRMTSSYYSGGGAAHVYGGGTWAREGFWLPDGMDVFTATARDAFGRG